MLAAPRRVRRGEGVAPSAGGRTTARPPVRAPRLADLVGGVHEVDPATDGAARTTRRRGRAHGPLGVWMRPGTYGDVAEEIRAVRERVSVMDVSTLGPVPGRRARRPRACSTRSSRLDVAGVAPGRARYLVALDEAGYVMDDGLLAALHDGRYLLTSTSGGADRMEAWLRDRIDRRDLHVHLVNQTASSARSTSRDRTRATCSRVCRTTTCPATRSRIRATPRSPWPASPAARSPRGSSASSRSSSTIPEVAQRRALGRAAGGRRDLGHPSARARRARRPAPGEGPHLPRPGHAARRSSREARARLGGRRWPSRSFVGKARARADGDAPARAAAGRAPVRRAAAARRAAHGRRARRRADHLVRRLRRRRRAIGLGWIRAVDGAFPHRPGDRRTSTATVVSTPFYDPEGVRLRA